MLQKPNPDIELADCYLKKVKSAASRNINFELSFAQFKKLWNTHKCYFTGRQLKHGVSWSLDRIDSSVGYTPSNTVVCDKDLNCKKGGLSLSEIEQIYKGLKKKKLI